MAATNITFRLDEEVKSDFEEFCENVGMNITTALNMFIRATLRERQLPFAVEDKNHDPKAQARKDFKKNLKEMQAISVKNGTDKITMEEIIADIAEYRAEKRAENA
ncbi:MAG: type II toxin-antitoxin system RelB/DinJ family antitoxin [Oscillospiraceae bacterium]|nr:type II toxin-antitoxin system RelB/DinJ family antitoxin [Oscillospiraceae bacterium]